MPRRLAIVSWGVLLCVTVVQGWPADTRGRNAVAEEGIAPDCWHFAGESLPLPPQQKAAWKAPRTTLSDEFVSATTLFFQQGLADPRGCEYRQIEVVVDTSGPGWQSTVVKTHGWVLPAAGRQSQRFGVCWNGLVYPLVSVGKPADLRADAAAAAKAKPQPIGYGTGQIFEQDFEDLALCHPSEARAVSTDAALPIKACLLLRLDEAELAEKVWNHWFSGLRNDWAGGLASLGVQGIDANDAGHIRQDPYLILVHGWTSALRARALACHLRGDDHLALVSLETLAATAPAWRRKGSSGDSPGGHLKTTNSWRTSGGGPGTAHDTGPWPRGDKELVVQPFFEILRRQVCQCPDGPHRSGAAYPSARRRHRLL